MNLSVDITEVQRSKLEAHKKAWKLRTLNEALRHLIEFKSDDEANDGALTSFVRGIRVASK